MTAVSAPRRGEVWLAEIDKVRPVVVLTRNPMGSVLDAVIVAPVTSTVHGISTEVEVGPADGVKLESVATSTTRNSWRAPDSFGGSAESARGRWRRSAQPSRSRWTAPEIGWR